MEVKIVGSDDPLFALVDTGFNRFLLLSEDQARTAGVSFDQLTTHTVYLADEDEKDFYEAKTTIDWFGEEVEVSVLIYPRPNVRRGLDRERAKIGVQLLRDCCLLIDFPAGKLSITRPG